MCVLYFYSEVIKKSLRFFFCEFWEVLNGEVKSESSLNLFFNAEYCARKLKIKKWFFRNSTAGFARIFVRLLIIERRCFCIKISIRKFVFETLKCSQCLEGNQTKVF